jgi:hypothetical protein
MKQIDVQDLLIKIFLRRLKKVKNIIILERRLFSAFGHERTQIKTINEYFKNTSSNVISCRNTNLNGINLKNKMYLDMPNFEVKEEGRESDNYIRESALKLESILKDKELETKTNLIIPSARTLEISILTLLFLENRFPKKMLPIVRIHGINYLDDLPKKVLESFIKLVNSNLVKFCSETEELSNIIKKNFKVKVMRNLIFPVTVPLAHRPGRNINKININIGCLGGPRVSKGTREIPALIKDLRKYIKNNNIDISVTFIVQMNKDKKKRTFIFYAKELMTRYISSLVKVKIIYGVSSGEEYLKLMSSVDIFLLPYHKSQYEYTGSGFIIDALLLEKPIIHSKGIAMNELTNFQNAIAIDGKDDFSLAVVKIVKNYDYYVKNSQTAKKYLINKINNSFKFLSEGS